jgi:hypothetical protein
MTVPGTVMLTGRRAYWDTATQLILFRWGPSAFIVAKNPFLEERKE